MSRFGFRGIGARRAVCDARVCRLAALLALVGVALLAGACRTVEPWERDALSQPRMAPEPHDAHAALLDHVRQSREAANIGDGSGGAGCGCY